MTAADSQRADFSSDNSRLVSLSDGVFAFALTLLVINLKLPDDTTIVQVGLARAVLDQSRALTTWVLSFFVISLYWLAHQRIFQGLKGHDSRFVWLNLLFLLCISFIWYPTAVLGTHGDQQFAVLFYDCSLILTSFVSLALWLYVAHQPDLLDLASARAAQAGIWWRTYGTVGVGVLSIAVSFVSVTAAELCWLLLILHRAGGERLVWVRGRSQE